MLFNCSIKSASDRKISKSDYTDCVIRKQALCHMQGAAQHSGQGVYCSHQDYMKFVDTIYYNKWKIVQTHMLFLAFAVQIRFIKDNFSRDTVKIGRSFSPSRASEVA